MPGRIARNPVRAARLVTMVSVMAGADREHQRQRADCGGIMGDGDTTTVGTRTVNSLAVSGDRLLRSSDVAPKLAYSAGVVRRMEGSVVNPSWGDDDRRHARSRVCLRRGVRGRRGHRSSRPEALGK